MSEITICFVCLGNICRSPTAEGVMLHLVERAGLLERFLIDSAGTGAYHVGESADPRSRAEALSRGVELPSIARQFVPQDFDRFQYVIAMDGQNQRELLRRARHQADQTKVHLLRSFDPKSRSAPDVPDPYYRGERGFADVFEICEAGCRGLLTFLREQHQL